LSRKYSNTKPNLPPRNLPSITPSSLNVSIQNLNSTYVTAQASRAIAGRFVGRKNRKERCKQFSEKRTSLYDLPKVTFPGVAAPDVEVL
tara:strand:- start:304 stop:570 length:267 start_codon:yes stop_codon:yes gene_type:complete